ncbi:hypothetical protein AKJ45_03070 [candidate division MSBL1 archaeon SCGC-AAA261F19]|uniref:HEPN domain-containing protein n=1 Tax=candidate division MSBL1 archaeon SCGC-AAA261F19 TaxID=1698275 RepID=A0A133V8Y8_9EURY|nr:hypothetical protein AKJ45_03070 [candidate division MSBL1 archaeon SCGC-AAA261F19]
MKRFPLAIDFSGGGRETNLIDSSSSERTPSDVTGTEKVIRLPSPHEHSKKAENLLEEGMNEYKKAEEIDEEFEVRKRGSIACEKVFHSLVELANAVLLRHRAKLPKTHDDRKEELHLIARGDLADLYAEAQSNLHHSGYYNQRLGDIQKMTITKVERKIKEERKIL